jgi:hypothetical protein
MVIPAAMNIEMAADSLKTVTALVKLDQLSELKSFGDTRAQDIGASGLSEDFKRGYELGLQVARVMIAGSVEVVLKGVNPEHVL